jgi:hypothetical protein
MLDQQQFTLTIDFINTQQGCDDVQITQTVHAYTQEITPKCSYNRSILTLSTVLDSHTISLQYNFDSASSIGGFRVSLYGKQLEATNASSNTNYLVRELNFIQPFFVFNGTLAYDPNIEFQLTRIINETDPLDANGEYYYTALWSPVSNTNISDLFFTFDDYIYYGLLETSFSISLSEMTYYVMNVQQPIVKQAEIIFHDLLFTIVCFELFGLVFITIKLICLPLFNRIRNFVDKHSNLIHPHHSSNSSYQSCKAPEQPSDSYEPTVIKI